jgi:SMI1 / KNR4 family (SUKH-1)
MTSPDEHPAHRDRLSRFGVHLLAHPSGRPEGALKELENSIGVSLPEAYRAFLLEYGAPFVFETDVAFRPLEKTHWERHDGTQSIVSFYGLGEGEGTLVHVNKVYRGRMPCGVLAIGESPGGNELCLCCDGARVGQVFLWDHEAEAAACGNDAPDYGNMYLLAKSFDDFIDGLEVRPESSDGGDLGIIDSESRLDF